MKNQLLKNFYLILGICCLTLLPLGAYAQGSVQELQQKVAHIEKVNSKNNQQVARAMNLLTQIQREFQSIKGQIDASKFLTQETDRVYQDLDVRVSSLEDKIDQIHQLMKEMVAAKKSGGPDPAAHAGEYADFQSLLAMVNNRDYRTAASGFLGFLRKYPQSQYTPKAMYWIGACF